jgi:ribosome-binding factor A
MRHDSEIKKYKKSTVSSNSQRQLKVAEMVRHALSYLFLNNEIQDFEESLLGLSITVSEVRVSPDLRVATVFVLPLGGSNNPDHFISLFTPLVPRIRQLLSQRISMRYVPDLIFRFDQTFDQVKKIDSLLQTVQKNDNAS